MFPGGMDNEITLGVPVNTFNDGLCHGVFRQYLVFAVPGADRLGPFQRVMREVGLKPLEQGVPQLLPSGLWPVAAGNKVTEFGGGDHEILT